MLCMNCRQRPARFHYTRTINGQTQEIHLCEVCAEAFKAQGAGGGGGLGLAGAGFGGTGLESIFEELMHPLLHRNRGRVRVWEQLGDDARRLIEAAGVLAAERGGADVRPEHLLLAMLDDPDVERQLVAMLGLDAAALRTRLEALLPAGASEGAPDEIALSARLKRVLQVAHQQASARGARLIGPAHLVLGLVGEGESAAAQLLVELAHPERARGEAGAQAGPARGGATPAAGAVAEDSALGKYTRDLTGLAEAGKLDPVIGREPEIERTVRILSRRTKNNPVLIGEPGVGKTAIAEGLAQRIVAGDVPEGLKGKRVLSLDLSGMVAGTKYRGEFEERLKGLIDEIQAREGEIVLFIDELHTVLGAGGAEGAMDAANMLKPALARGELRAIGATTLDEFRKHIEKDAALERRFQPVLVEEPTPEQSIAILRGLKDLYEAHHAVRIDDAALVAAVELADKYVTDRFLPDKAIDLIDEAGAMKHLAGRRQPGRVAQLEQELERARCRKEEAIGQERFEEAQAHKRRCDELEQELGGLLKGWREEAGQAEPIVGVEDVAKVVSEWTGIPAQKLVAEERQRLLEMESHLHARVIGQEAAIRAVSEAVRRARTGMKDARRPIGSFIFLGPTGVGKTELAKALAEYLFNDEDAMVRFDMSEYQEKHTVSRLVGAPPGYVGYEEAGQLSEALRRKPYSVVLFDEIEKAHPDVFNILLQLLDDGRLTDAKGKTVDAKNTVVIMTSNVGAPRIFELEEAGAPWKDIEAAAMEALKAKFRPEFLNRVDETVVFHPLSQAQIGQIVDLMLAHTERKVHAQGYGLVLTDAAKQALAEAGFDPTYGARPLRRAIAREIETPIARLLLGEDFAAGDRIRVDHAGDAFVITREAAAQEAPRELAGAGGGGGGRAASGVPTIEEEDGSDEADEAVPGADADQEGGPA